MLILFYYLLIVFLFFVFIVYLLDPRASIQWWSNILYLNKVYTLPTLGRVYNYRNNACLSEYLTTLFQLILIFIWCYCCCDCDKINIINSIILFYLILEFAFEWFSNAISNFGGISSRISISIFLIQWR